MIPQPAPDLPPRLSRKLAILAATNPELHATITKPKDNK